ncbi:MAG TPA: hypothetical protein VFU06_08770 [Longimicrobiales bacterium]|nr:hypothetical protein [Longimicrobiales bacterium]
MLFALCALVPASVAAQVPDTARTPADTLRAPADTLRQAPDSLPGRQQQDTTAQDTLPPEPPPPLPVMPPVIPAGFATGVWEWDREALIREPFLSVTDLLDRIPGIVPLRTGLYMHPEAASAWGASAGGLEVELDGYTLWPLDDPTFDLSHIELGTLEAVRIERRGAGVRIVLRTVEPFSGEAYTRIEAGIGEPIGVNVFRGVFLAPKFMFGPFGAGVERFETEGINAQEPGDLFTGWVKWGVTGERAGAQLEVRQQSFERGGSSPWPTELDRRDLILRTRWAPADGIALEAYGGHSRASFTAAVDDAPDIERDVVQAGTRGSIMRGPLRLQAGFRFNNERRLPVAQLDARSWLQLHPVLGFGGEVQHSRWRDDDVATSYQLQGVLTPVRPLSLFAQYSGGSTGAPAWEDLDRYILQSEHTQLRAGGSLRWRGIDVGAAYLDVERDSLFGFGLPFDSAATPLAGGHLKGWELYGRLPLFRDIVSVDGGLTSWFDWDTSIYTPSQSWRAALQAHWVPLESGNLEILARVQARDRDGFFLPITASPDLPDLAVAPGSTLFDGWLVIRIVSVQAFLRYEDMSGHAFADAPGRVVSGPRIVYGVKWSFLN